MSKAQPQLPDLLPVLSRGKHRNPRKGACFMELASYLAGERWSDHPACTHPLLASVARLVNDHTSDQGRPSLAELIPSVIGLTGDDLHIDALITLRCATIALPTTGRGFAAIRLGGRLAGLTWLEPSTYRGRSPARGSTKVSGSTSYAATSTVEGSR
jgi:hypothetical protein